MNKEQETWFLNVAMWRNSEETIEDCCSWLLKIIDDRFDKAKKEYEKKYWKLSYDEQIKLQRDLLEWLLPWIKSRFDKFRQDFILSNWIKTWVN